MSIFEEFRRRKVFQVAGVYAVVAWLLIQIAASVFPLLRLPDWAATLVTVLLILGFPVAIVLAWAYEIQPDSGHLQRSEPVTGRAPFRWLVAGAIGISALLAIFVGRSALFPSAAVLPVPPDRWDQLTNFPDFATQPALSRDGRMLTFIRGPGNFVTSGDVYIKLLPDGTPVPLTRDDHQKMSPVFSPEGSRIAYTVVVGQFDWDTWWVETLGGEPGLWLKNASGLGWTDGGDLMFSERIVGEGIHMKAVTARETRENTQNIYVPPQASGMVHRSYPSPDGEWAIIVQMDETTAFLPCELVALRGAGPRRQVGPRSGSCTFADWSPDGEYMYFTSSLGGRNHIWRQKYPDGEVEQVTSGPGHEEGIAMASDGMSLVTSVALRQSSVWLSEAGVERQISLEGFAFDPEFSADGRSLLYRILLGPAPVSDASELWIADLETGRRQQFLPDFELFGFNAYSVSSEGDVLFAAPDNEGLPRLWIVPLDRSAPPKQLLNVQGDQPFFAPDGEIFFRAGDGGSQYIYRSNRDGTGLRRAIEYPIAHFAGLSPDGEWLVAWAELTGDSGLVTYAFPLDGRDPMRLYQGGGTNHSISWSRDGRYLFLPAAGGGWLDSGGFGETILVPIPQGQLFPDVPEGGFTYERAIAAMPDISVISSGDVRPGVSPDVYAFSRESVQSNLYRIPLP